MKINKIMPCNKLFKPHIKIVNKGKYE